MDSLSRPPRQKLVGQVLDAVYGDKVKSSSSCPRCKQHPWLSNDPLFALSTHTIGPMARLLSGAFPRGRQRGGRGRRPPRQRCGRRQQGGSSCPGLTPGLTLRLAAENRTSCCANSPNFLALDFLRCSVELSHKAINYGEMTAASWAGVLKVLGQPPGPSAVVVQGAAALARLPPPPRGLASPRAGSVLGCGDCFVDLGSGRGCLVLQAALACPGMR